jgi:hypoxanthine phosphoribosyltransferase
MVKLTFKHGLLYTDITIFHQGKEVLVKDVIVDTGDSHSIISPVFLEQPNTEYSMDDKIVMLLDSEELCAAH